MSTDMRHASRRHFLKLAAAVPAAALAPVPVVWAQAGRPRPTPACGDSGPTPPQTAGPYFKPRSPERASLLEPGMPGTRLRVEGTVLGADCAPVPRALIDVWHADDHGEYDNAGYRLRGHLYTDERGRYRLETIVPGRYPGRTRHLHVKVQAPGQSVLTTQLYFPDERDNRRDGIFDPDLVMRVSDADRGKVGRFDFVLAAPAPRRQG
jgi:protocatechuate 3,4-dioxygenase beta subunit